MKIRFDLFTENGKWKYGGECEVPDTLDIWHNDVLDTIDKCQQEVVPGVISSRNYNCVVDLIENKTQPNKFFNHMWLANQTEEQTTNTTTTKIKFSDNVEKLLYPLPEFNYVTGYVDRQYKGNNVEEQTTNTTTTKTYNLTKLEEEIRAAINRNSAENGSNTPDFVLAQYLIDCLNVFDKAVNYREKMYGRKEEPIIKI